MTPKNGMEGGFGGKMSETNHAKLQAMDRAMSERERARRSVEAKFPDIKRIQV